MFNALTVWDLKNIMGEVFCFVLFLLQVAVLGFELGLTLAKQALYHLSHSTSPFLGWVFL
jgi:hypothetical protein